MLPYILASVILVSVISLIGVFLLSIKTKVLEKILFVLIALASGGMLGGAFLHLLPESLEASTAGSVFAYTLVGIVAFFVLEKFLWWHHCHKESHDHEPHTKPFTYLNLIGDGVHNFIDGAVIAASFLVNIPLGIATTIAIIFHEIPQEIGDFGVLIYGGFSKLKALSFNLLSALTAIIGALVVYFASFNIESLIPFILPFAAGNFIYIATVDLIPELRKGNRFGQSVAQFVFLLVGILILWGLSVFTGQH